MEGAPAAKQGVIDLRNWNFERNEGVPLSGLWEFCWGRTLGPADFPGTGKREDCGYINVPGIWKNQNIDGKILPGTGRATYRLKILSGPDDRIKSLSLRRVLSAYKLWVNGKLADEKGTEDRPIKTREDYIFIHNKHLSSFRLKEGINEIIIQVFNRDYESGGIDRPLVLEDGEAAARGEFNRHMINMIVVGFLLFSAVYNIILFFFRRVDAAPLYLGFASFIWAINTYNIQSPILPAGLSWPPNPFVVNYLTVVLGTVFIVMVTHAMYPVDYSIRLVRIFKVISLGFMIALLFLGFRHAEQAMKVFFFAIMAIIAYSTYSIIKSIIKRREDALLFFIGFLFLYSAGINNTLYALWLIDTGNFVPYGMVVLCFTTSMVISRRFARALRTVEKLSEDLEEKNLSLQRLDRLKDQFLANTSHELRTPLHGMIGLSESMIQGADGGLPPRALEDLSLIASSGHRLASMVNDLLDMARIQEEGLSLNFRTVDLHSLSEMVVKLSLPLAGGKHLRIVNRIEPGVPRVLADEDRIRQVLHNLVGNAIKFTNTGTVELYARVIAGDTDEGPLVEVSVSDTGIGIPDDYRERIFDAYLQVDEGDARLYPGTGLGLAIVKRIMELHNGSIRVASVEGGGSVFSFTLPVSGEAEADAADAVIVDAMDDAVPDRPLAVPGGDAGDFTGNPVLLVVDDDPVNVKVIQNCFESKRCAVRTAPDGIRALDIIEREGPIDLVLLDIMMPVMSGFEVCRRIRLYRSPEELPVIMLTAKNMMADIDTAFEAGANDYIVKPFRINELLVRVRSMLALKDVRKPVNRGITIRDRNRAYTLRYGEIIYITSHSKNSVIHTGEGDIEVPVMMKDVVHRLPPDIFVRIHKSHIININYVHSMSHVLSGRYRVRLRDGDDTVLPVGPAFLESLRKMI